MRFATHFSHDDWIDWGRNQPVWTPAVDSQAEDFDREVAKWLGKAPVSLARSPEQTTEIRAELEKFASSIRSLKDESKPDGAETTYRWTIAAALGSIFGGPILVKLGIATLIAADIATGGLALGSIILGTQVRIKQIDVEARNRRFDSSVMAVAKLRDHL